MFATKPRHPELVSGPTSPNTRSDGGEAQSNRKIMPVGVWPLDQVDLPRPMPTLELFFARNGWFHFVKKLEVDQSVDAVLAGESGDRHFAVLPQPADKVGRNANVQRAARLARKDVDARLPLVSHNAVFAEGWTLKRVQGDERRREVG